MDLKRRDFLKFMIVGSGVAVAGCEKQGPKPKLELSQKDQLDARRQAFIGYVFDTIRRKVSFECGTQYKLGNVQLREVGGGWEFVYRPAGQASGNAREYTLKIQKLSIAEAQACINLVGKTVKNDLKCLPPQEGVHNKKNGLRKINFLKVIFFIYARNIRT